MPIFRPTFSGYFLRQIFRPTFFRPFFYAIFFQAIFYVNFFKPFFTPTFSGHFSRQFFLGIFYANFLGQFFRPFLTPNFFFATKVLIQKIESKKVVGNNQPICSYFLFGLILSIEYWCIGVGGVVSLLSLSYH